MRERSALGGVKHKNVRRRPEREQQRRRRLGLVADLRQARSNTAQEDDAFQRRIVENQKLLHLGSSN